MFHGKGLQSPTQILGFIVILRLQKIGKVIAFLCQRFKFLYFFFTKLLLYVNSSFFSSIVSIHQIALTCKYMWAGQSKVQEVDRSVVYERNHLVQTSLYTNHHQPQL